MFLNIFKFSQNVPIFLYYFFLTKLCFEYESFHIHISDSYFCGTYKLYSILNPTSTYFICIFSFYIYLFVYLYVFVYFKLSCCSVSLLNFWYQICLCWLVKVIVLMDHIQTTMTMVSIRLGFQILICIIIIITLPRHLNDCK